ncbi:MAG TPA: O-antigen ligase family protein [Candidatus Omnitrophota bacterium]|nr:O-antigen ligase family protein [Candidatus Omnitrophota bacterium]
MLDKLKILFFSILFAWISFFPQPLQERYFMPVRLSLCLFLIIFLLEQRGLKNLFNFKDWPLWLFLITLSAGTVSALNKNLAIKTYLYLFTTLFFVFYIGKAIFRFDKDRDMVCLVICLLSGIVALIGLMELHFGKNILYENFIANPYYERYVRCNPRPMSTLLNPVILGSYLLGCLPFSLYFLKNKSLALRILGISSSLLCAAIIIRTFSRGVFLGLIVLLLFYLWKGRKKLLLWFIFCLSLFIIICSYQKDPNLNRFGFSRFISGSYDSVFSEYRFSRVKMTFRILKEHPFAGIGFNHFRLRFDEYCEPKYRSRELYEFMIPDNMYLTLLAEAGIIGAFGFLFFIFFLLKTGLKSSGRLNLLVFSAMLGLLANMAGYDLFYWQSTYMLFCLILGFINALSLNASRA